MRWIMLAAGCVAVLALLERHYRKRQYWQGPYLVQQIAEWYERDAYGDEPTITPIVLPPIRPLQARPAARADRVARFKGRVSR